MAITRERLIELVLYNPIDGSFVWRYSRGGHIKQGEPAGFPHYSGYITLKLDGKMYQAHRLAWLWVYGRWPKEEIDHENLNRADNKINNLREATHSQNQHNTSAYKNNSTGMKGVTYLKQNKKWMAQIQRNKQNYYLGVYNTPEEAHVAYKTAAKEFFGEFARTE
jgi:hypothetical protein